MRTSTMSWVSSRFRQALPEPAPAPGRLGRLRRPRLSASPCAAGAAPAREAGASAAEWEATRGLSPSRGDYRRLARQAKLESRDDKPTVLCVTLLRRAERVVHSQQASGGRVSERNLGVESCVVVAPLTKHLFMIEAGTEK
jgi:hypothetical protein